MQSISGGSISSTFSYDPNGNQTSGLGRSISYTSYNKPSSITQGSITLFFSDDTDHQRFKQVSPEGTTLYFTAFGVHAELFVSGTSQWYDYIGSGGSMLGVRVLSASSVTTRYFHTDNLGSIAVITNETGAVVERDSYDAWGKRRFPNGADDPSGSLTSQTTRGFTGQEELADVSELIEVIRLIESGECEDVYSLLEILGRSGSSSHKRLMERYLRDVGDSQLSSLALKALCSWWGLFGEYRSNIISFLNGVDWDVDDYIKLQAISISGEYLRKENDIEILKTVYGIFSNGMERPLIRSAAYFALCRSEGLEWRDIPPASRILDFSKEVNHAVVAHVESKLRGELS